MAKKGKLLEQLVWAIQNTIKDNPDVRIYTNRKIKDTNKIKREFDVMVESVINRVNVCIIFECKDYKRPVGVNVVDGLLGKCAAVPSVNKKIIVSQTGFTKSARQKAENNGIELYSLETVPLDDLLWKVKSTYKYVKCEVLPVLFFTKENDEKLYAVDIDDIEGMIVDSQRMHPEDFDLDQSGRDEYMKRAIEYHEDSKVSQMLGLIEFALPCTVALKNNQKIEFSSFSRIVCTGISSVEADVIKQQTIENLRGLSVTEFRSKCGLINSTIVNDPSAQITKGYYRDPETNQLIELEQL